ncbi:hypothetical protein CJ030_MR2G000238 [Morella rubra]|uniref:PGG domain-containing protein n=1 Tax=Morella rubra TaxID=262757 RepID=A0A6A1WC47_9ROSI|nr:hypothetical protein CJ030_MR2G000238 [Morella rubra]
MRDIIAGFLDEKNNNMLHLVGQLAPPDRLNIVSGAALQMQRELLWVKEIEKILPPPRANMKNSDGQTPVIVFTKAHQGLQEAGEKWMKDTSNSCMIVATLIATVVFAAPLHSAWRRQSTDRPSCLFRKQRVYGILQIRCIAFISSTTSISIFLSILTSRYTENDFLQPLPARLTSGFAALFISIVGMVIAFTATCFFICESKMTKVPNLIIVSFAVPVILFIWLHYDLWVDVIRSAYQSRSLFWRHRSRLI